MNASPCASHDFSRNLARSGAAGIPARGLSGDVNLSTYASHSYSGNWMRPEASASSLRLRAEANRSLIQDLALVLAPGMLGVLALGVLMMVMR